MNIDIISISVAFIGGTLLTQTVYYFQKTKIKQKEKHLLDKAKREADKIIKKGKYKLREEQQTAKENLKKEQRKKEQEWTNIEKIILQKEIKLKNEIEELQSRQSELEKLKKELREQIQKNQNKQLELAEVIEKEMKQMENIAHFTKDQAKKWIMEQVHQDARVSAAELSIQIKNEAKEKSNREAKDVLAKAIENMAYEYTVDSTLTSIPLPNDKMKGMLIGREGKNIRALEEITEVKLIIDDTPETVIVSGFDPIKRDIAGRTVADLVENKNINPKEIEKVWKRKKQEVEKEMRRAAADTLRELKIKNVSDEMFEMLGRLKYRTSYGQNILQHSIEVAKLAAHMAAELGLDVDLAKRAGLFHDLGKANSHDAEASHVAIGVEVCTRANEHPVVINAVLSHHEEAEPISPISVLVNAADKISGSRPGARRDSLEQYTNRISSLEKIASAHDGVSKVYAMSAGREIRVIVEPSEINDAKAEILSTDIAKDIQANMEYPGHIKVTIIRRTILSQLTDDYQNLNKRYTPNPDVEQLEEEVERSDY
jgi:ribonuclease Y